MNDEQKEQLISTHRKRMEHYKQKIDEIREVADKEIASFRQKIQEDYDQLIKDISL